MFLLMKYPHFRIGGASAIRTLATLTVFTVVCVMGCGTSKRSDSQVSEPSRTGRLVINLQFDVARPFIDGLAAVRIGDDKTGKYGFIARQ
jgi:hypothetical protein